MKQEQLKQAEQLYFQTSLNKSQIAEVVGVSRRSLHYWIKSNNWARVKQSSEHMPGYIAENIYHVLGHLTSHLLSEHRAMRPVTSQEADTMYKLTMTINKLKTRNTLNESMEMMAYFMEGLNAKDPELAERIQPHIGDYISARAAVHPARMMPEKFNAQGFIPHTGPKDAKEDQLDIADIMAWTEKPPVDIDQFRPDAIPPTPQDAPQPAHLADRSGTTPPVSSLDNDAEITQPAIAGAEDPVPVNEKKTPLTDAEIEVRFNEWRSRTEREETARRNSILQQSKDFLNKHKGLIPDSSPTHGSTSATQKAA